MRSKFIKWTIAAMCILPLAANAASQGGPNGPTGGQKPQALPLPKGEPQRPVGVSALTVKPGAKPLFTLNEVAAYVAKRNLPMNAGDARSISVAALDFISAREASARLGGAQTGLPDQYVVGFATLKGRMIFSGPSGVQSAAFERGYAIFDATSGNLLMVGSL